MSTAVPLYKSRLRGRWPPRTPHISDSAPQQGSDWAKSLLPPLDLHDKHGAGWRWGGGGGGGQGSGRGGKGHGREAPGQGGRIADGPPSFERISASNESRNNMESV